MNSIRMPAVIVNQIAAKTGAVVRNFCIGGNPGDEDWGDGDQRGETVTLLSDSVSLPPVKWGARPLIVLRSVDLPDPVEP